MTPTLWLSLLLLQGLFLCFRTMFTSLFVWPNGERADPRWEGRHVWLSAPPARQPFQSGYPMRAGLRPCSVPPPFGFPPIVPLVAEQKMMLKERASGMFRLSVSAVLV